MSPRHLAHRSLSTLVHGQHSDLEDQLRQQIVWARTVPLPDEQYRFALDEQPPRQGRFDFAWPTSRVALEIQGGTFIATGQALRWLERALAYQG